MLRVRMKQFAMRIIRMHVELSKQRDETIRVLSRQCLRSGTSVGAQYREACRARSGAECISKTQSALQGLEETLYWLELLVDSGLVTASKLVGLREEADQLIAMLVASVNTAKRSTKERVRNRI